MVRATKTLLRSVGYALHLRVYRETKAQDLLGLMAKLRPLDCGLELIRIGAPSDGGYLIPNDLEAIEYCFSPGVSEMAEFEDQLASLGIKSFLADYSVDRPPNGKSDFVFDKKFLGASDRDDYFTLASWKDKYLKNYAGDLLLQMDIEGSEYEVILNTPDSLLDQFRIAAIEFHYLDRLWDPFVFGLYSSCFEKLLEHFYVVHIHPNSHEGSLIRGNIHIPRAMEFTFLNKKRVHQTKPQVVFPHKLDADCLAGRSLPLPKCWYAS